MARSFDEMRDSLVGSVIAVASLVLAVLLLGRLGSGLAEGKRALVDGGEPVSGWAQYADQLPAEGVVPRFLEATRLFLGTPYENGPLGEGAAGGPDPDPRVDLKRADCVTYLEQSLALALAQPGASEDSDYNTLLDAIRYRDGEVDYVTRNHYMVADWIPANAWLLEDVTTTAGGPLTQRVRRTIDRASFLTDNGAVPREGIDDSQEIEIDIIPVEAIAKIEPNLHSGDLIFWVGKREGIFVVHTGLAVRSEERELLFRHASSKAGEALEESLGGYAGRASFAAGILVLRIREDARLNAPAQARTG